VRAAAPVRLVSHFAFGFPNATRASLISAVDLAIEQ
jgi:hypothetical protein